IAEAVADYLPERCTVFITIGTTVEAVARALLNRRDLRIITNSLRVAQILYKNQDIEVMVPGGRLWYNNRGVSGFLVGWCVGGVCGGGVVWGVGGGG
ncbi:DeoR family transcriptional regulator, partial [Escherichia coli]|nr:DeoR family transcriptional regulator [Escherichia coli]